jgi:hypothetical protein
MGKAADNERIKLRATFYNNISVGCFLTGFLVPYLTFIREGNEARVIIANFLHGNFSQFSELGPLGYNVFAMFLAFVGAAIMRGGPTTKWQNSKTELLA